MNKIKRKALKKTFEENFNPIELLAVMCIVFAIVGSIIGGVKNKPVHHTENQIKIYASIVEKTYPNNGPVILEEGSAILYSYENSKTVEFKVKGENSPTLTFKIMEDGSAILMDTNYSTAICKLIFVGIILYALLGAIVAAIISGIIIGSMYLIEFIEERISDTKETYQEELKKLKEKEFH